MCHSYSNNTEDINPKADDLSDILVDIDEVQEQIDTEFMNYFLSLVGDNGDYLFSSHNICDKDLVLNKYNNSLLKSALVIVDPISLSTDYKVVMSAQPGLSTGCTYVMFIDG